LSADSFFSADHRYGWVGFYRRDSYNSPFATVYIFTLQNPNFPNYTTTYPPGSSSPYSPAPTIPPAVSPPIPPLVYNYASGVTIPTAGTAAYLAPVFAPSAFGANKTNAAATPPAPVTSFSTGYNSVTLQPPDASGNAIVEGLPTNAVTGEFLLVADDGTTTAVPPLLTGRFLRLGNPDPNIAGAYYLQPGYDFSLAEYTQLTSASATGNNSTGSVDVFLIGRAPAADTNGGFTGPFTGPNQDIGVASGFVRVNTTNN
jgi:hypothetical protein